MVRSAAEWASVVARNPFRNEAARDPARLVVVFLKSKPTADAFDALRETLVGPEILHGEGRQAYIVYPVSDARGSRRRSSNASLPPEARRATGTP
jgi:uncharacterized protein (DUF1697 family)